MDVLNSFPPYEPNTSSVRLIGRYTYSGSTISTPEHVFGIFILGGNGVSHVFLAGYTSPFTNPTNHYNYAVEDSNTSISIRSPNATYVTGPIVIFG